MAHAETEDHKEDDVYQVGGLPPITDDYHRLLHDFLDADWTDVLREHSIDRYIAMLSRARQGTLRAPHEDPRWQTLRYLRNKLPNCCLV
jgi:hypothetical protein